MRALDLSEQRFGNLVAIERAERVNGNARWVCRCDCGNDTIVYTNNLRQGRTKSCGCSSKVNRVDLAGKRFGRLTAIKPTEKRSFGNVVWAVVCDCGTLTEVRGGNLQNNTQSCGCLGREESAKRCRTRTTHGHHTKGKPSPTYNSWSCMIQRCTNPNATSYEYYGAKGVPVDPRWVESFEAFLHEMGERPEGTTLHRKDKTKGYCKENCVWADDLTQGREAKSIVKLTMEKARYIRALHATGDFSQKTLAEQFKVCPTTISFTVHNQIWQETAA